MRFPSAGSINGIIWSMVNRLPLAPCLAIAPAKSGRILLGDLCSYSVFSDRDHPIFTRSSPWRRNDGYFFLTLVLRPGGTWVTNELPLPSPPEANSGKIRSLEAPPSLFTVLAARLFNS